MRPLPSRLFFAALIALSTTACIVVPPRGGRAITRAEAVEIALRYSASHGYRAEVRGIERDDDEWRVMLSALPPFAGELEVEVDPFGAVIREHGGFERHHRRHEHHGDDEDDD